MGSVLLYSDGRTDGPAAITNLIIFFLYIFKAPKNKLCPLL